MPRTAKQKKLPMSVSISADRRKWIRENYESLGFRSESHAVDEALRLLIESRGSTRKRRSAR